MGNNLPDAKLVRYHQGHFMHLSCYEDAAKYEVPDPQWDKIILDQEDIHRPCAHFDCHRPIGVGE